MPDQKVTQALGLSSFLNDIVEGKIHKEGIYKDDDVTIKGVIKENDIEELMRVVDFNTKQLAIVKKEIEEKSIEISVEDLQIIDTKKQLAEEFFLKGSTNFIKGFSSPDFYIDANEILFFQVKVDNGEIDLAEITRTPPGSKPQTKVAGGVINDGIFVKVPVEIDVATKYPIGTTYKVTLTSTNKAMKATFNYTFKGI